MIRIKIFLDQHNCLKELHAAGHAGLAVKGKDLVCAAASALLRTAGNLIQANNRINAAGTAAREGEMELRLLSVADSELDWLKGVSDFCIAGLNDLMQEYPAQVYLTIQK